MNVVGRCLRVRYKPKLATPKRAERRLQDPKADAAPPASLAVRHDVSSRAIGGMTSYSVAPRVRPVIGVVAYLQGSG
jgi:hypothetical protein